jgi:hypothetical protein
MSKIGKMTKRNQKKWVARRIREAWESARVKLSPKLKARFSPFSGGMTRVRNKPLDTEPIG